MATAIFLMQIGAVRAEDFVKLANVGGGEVGILVDGLGAGGCEIDDGMFFSSLGIITVGDMRRSALSNEVIAFTADRRPELMKVLWGENSDNFGIEFKKIIDVAVVIWVIQGPFEGSAGGNFRAAKFCAQAAALWRNEMSGINLSPCVIIDQTENSKAALYRVISSADVNDKVWYDLANDIGFEERAINVYIVNKVEGDSYSGASNFERQIVLSYESEFDLLAHEVGHAFSLWDAEFLGGSNIMNGDSKLTDRRYLTEGQIFRANFNEKSVINVKFNERVFTDWRDCGSFASGPFCPVLHLRLWTDGGGVRTESLSVCQE